VGCTVNVAAGHELRLGEALLEPVAVPRQILVIGAGPAGMEAARVAALRGHQVTLADARPEPGGTLRVARLAPNHEHIGEIADWLISELARLGVRVLTSTMVDLAFIEQLSPDAVILAAGATPRMDGHQRLQPGREVEGVTQEHVVSTEQLLIGHHNRIGASALVFDDVGGYEAIGAAEYLIEQGAAVTFATSHVSFAPRMETALATRPALERLNRGQFTLLTRATLERIDAQTSAIGSLDGGPTQTVDAETVVLVTLNRPNDSLAAALAKLGIDCTVVGDARHPEFLPAAFSTGHLAGRSV
jgi:NADPH-dependent 2,4-dienoyl-CoA reductase/sulfur reductase-like enzyme